MENVVPNFVIALRIRLSKTVLVSTGERAFSKLKIVKSYSRSSMKSERLNDFAVNSIEHEVAETINYNEVSEVFANEKARKMIFE